jgi:hypothetical protein
LQKSKKKLDFKEKLDMEEKENEDSIKRCIILRSINAITRNTMDERKSEKKKVYCKIHKPDNSR